MASVDIWAVSSSPPRPFRSFNNISSSPDLPSPSDLFKRKRRVLPTGSGLDSTLHNAAALSKSTSVTPFSIDRPSTGISLSFELGSTGNSILEIKKPKHAKTSSIAKADSVQEADNLTGPRKKASKHQDVSIKGVAAKNQRQKKTDGEPTDVVAKIEKKARKPRPKKADKPVGEDGIKEKAPRKSRAKKTDGPAQTKMSLSQVTKPSMPSKAKTTKDATKSKKPELVSRHFSTAEFSKASEDSLDNGLLDAVKRRTCWTPPKPTVETFITTQSDAADESNSIVEYASPGEKSSGFSDLFSNFAFSSVQIPVSGRKLSDSSGIKKRKLTEMVPTSGSTSNTATATPKAKAQRKKARTITDQATSAYSTTPGSLLQYLSVETSNPRTNDDFKIPTKPRSKNPVKTSSKRGKGTAQAPILLSPESALKQVGNQDFVFGTSSQLAREESPTFLRDIHAAMQASNEVDEYDPFTSSPVAPIYTKEKPVSLPAKRNLWSAAARDIGGKLLDIEMVDLANSPATTSRYGHSFVSTGPAGSIIPKVDSIWHDIDELVVDTVAPVSNVTRPPKIPLPSEPPSLSLSNLMGPGLSPRALRMPQSSDSIPHLTQSTSTNNTPTTECDPDKPDYSSYTSAELAKEIASYRFKPLKNRDHMISLLERCWEGKKRTALGSLQANAMLHSSSKPVTKPPSNQLETLSPKRPRGRPPKINGTGTSPKAKVKKTVSTATIATIAAGHNEPSDDATKSKDGVSKKAAVLKKGRKKTKEIVDEISDSDAPLTPSPPRRRPSQIRTSPLPLQVASSAAVEESLAQAQESSQIRLFEHITRAVTSTPPSKDPTNPSWHEKILLYDPVILEDLTVWLNTGALEKAGWDGEVNPSEVKKWCVSKSICCLWKENLRGGVRTRF